MSGGAEREVALPDIVFLSFESGCGNWKKHER
jgi:hypothetical protein